MAVTKRDLVDDLVGAHPDTTRKAATEMVNNLLASMAAALQRGESIRLSGFGTFAVRDRKARVARNPKTKAPVNVAATKVVRFKAARALKASVAKPARKKRG
ncbi:MAG: integration host factor subunit beta [Deltaproteobacteria bacterium]|jgi:nucleoid DNA-binding protein|nr:integration host factor subunit beta [Deltaproteobacteria bacterium]